MTTTTEPTTGRQRSLATLHGYPRQGPDRELKRAIESYWSDDIDAGTLLTAARELRRQRLGELHDAGIDEVPVNDFSLYDHVLDTAVMLGAVPARHTDAVPDVDTDRGRLDRYFAMARGTGDTAPLEMTKWFNTNYHYLVPELGVETRFELDSRKPIEELHEARDLGIDARPVILGPVSFLLLAKASAGQPEGFRTLDLLPQLVPVYVDLLRQFREAGAAWVQLDEPCLVTDQPRAVLDATALAYRELVAAAARPKLLVAAYFDRLGHALRTLHDAGVDGFALDFCGPAAANVDDIAAIGGLGTRRLVAGVVDGHNIWVADLPRALTTLSTLLGLADTVDVATSCSLLHVPLDVRLERGLDPALAGWLSFARQKIGEVVALARGISEGRDAIAGELQVNQTRRAARRSSPMVQVTAVRDRVAAVSDDDLRRTSPYTRRRERQRTWLALPPLPTTTIGSFPQTRGVRAARAGLRAGTLTAAQYEDAMRTEIASVVAEQEELGLDVLVHGEPERNDMVQYFAEQLDGFLVTTHGWVQSYGTRYVRPPIIVGDVSRPGPMTVDWSRYAQSLTDSPMKGMLTGPVTMLAWSFVRDDQPLADTARQVALALRDEVADLEAADIGIIQVDEPALRELLPLREADRPDYLAWAVDAFRLTTAGVTDATQIHTHMCYADFEDILQAIVDLDADVITLEAARSDMGIVADLAEAGYPNDLGPGLWDIHSPRVPTVEEIRGRLRAAISAFPSDRLWVNPDCGLKTRGYPEVRASLANLVAAARAERLSLPEDDATRRPDM